jgi:hypothetical protein
MFVVEEDRNLKLLTQGATLKHPAPMYGKAPYYPIDPSTSSGACSSLNPHAGPYYLAAMMSQGILVRATISQPSTGTLSSSSSGASPDRDFTEDYPKIGAVAIGTRRWKVALLAWWPQHLLETSLVGTPPPEDQKCPMPICLITEWFRI